MKIEQRNCMIQTNEGYFKARAVFDGHEHVNGHEIVLIKSLESNHTFRCFRGVADNKFNYGDQNPTFYAC